MSVLRRYFSAEPFPWSIWLFTCRLVQKAKDSLLAAILRAPGICLGPRSVVRGAKCIVFGRDFSAYRNLWLEAVHSYRGQRFAPRIEIGDSVHLSDGVHITCVERIVIKKNVLMGSRIYISDHNHGCYKGAEQSQPGEPPAWRQLGGGGPVEIGENVWIGDNVVIVGPATIGDAAIIGANSIVRGNVPPQTIVAGAPARVIKRFNHQTRCWERA